MLAHIIVSQLEGSCIQFFSPLPEPIHEGGIDYPANIELGFISTNMYCDNTIIYNHWAATLARKSADVVADLGRLSFNNLNSPLTSQPILIQLHSFSTCIKGLEVIFKRTYISECFRRVCTRKAEHL